MTGDELFDYAAAVDSREKFITFVRELNVDFHERRDEWQNHDLQTFLNGLAGFAEDMAGYYRNMGEDVDVDQVSWRMVAQMLLASTVYGS